MEPLKLTTLKHLVKLLSYKQRAELARTAIDTESIEERTRLIKNVIGGDYELLVRCNYCGATESSCETISDDNTHVFFCDTCNKYVCIWGYGRCGTHLDDYTCPDKEFLCISCSRFKCSVCKTGRPGIASRCDVCADLVCLKCTKNDVCITCINAYQIE